MPIIFLVKQLIIGPPEEPSNVLHKCLISLCSSPICSIPFPYDIYASSELK